MLEVLAHSRSITRMVTTPSQPMPVRIVSRLSPLVLVAIHAKSRSFIPLFLQSTPHPKLTLRSVSFARTHQGAKPWCPGTKPWCPGTPGSPGPWHCRQPGFLQWPGPNRKAARGATHRSLVKQCSNAVSWVRAVHLTDLRGRILKEK